MCASFFVVVLCKKGRFRLINDDGETNWEKNLFPKTRANKWVGFSSQETGEAQNGNKKREKNGDSHKNKQK